MGREHQLWEDQCENRKEGAIEFEVRDFSRVRTQKPPTNLLFSPKIRIPVNCVLHKVV